MTNNNKNPGFRTDAFLGALKINEDRNKYGKARKEYPAPVAEKKNDTIITDAFLEALKINEELNKKYNMENR